MTMPKRDEPDDVTALLVNSNAIQILMILNKSRTQLDVDLGMLLGLADMIRRGFRKNPGYVKLDEQVIERWRHEISGNFRTTNVRRIKGD
jgi:hypothetical protein